MAANYIHKIENTSFWKEEISYGDDTLIFYMGRIFEELKHYAYIIG